MPLQVGPTGRQVKCHTTSSGPRLLHEASFKMTGLPADAQAKEEHDQGVQVPHGCSVTHIMGWQALK